MTNEEFELCRSIEDFIDAFSGTAIGQNVKNRYENSDKSVESLESIVDYLRR